MFSSGQLFRANHRVKTFWSWQRFLGVARLGKKWKHSSGHIDWRVAVSEHSVSSQPNPSVRTNTFFGICSIFHLPLSCVEHAEGRNSLWRILPLAVRSHFSRVQNGTRHWCLKICRTPLYLCSLSLMENYSLSLDTQPRFGVIFSVLGWSLKKKAKLRSMFSNLFSPFSFPTKKFCVYQIC